MHVLIAVDSFKGSLSSQKAGEAMTLGIQRVFPKASTEIISMADGGEGTVEAIVSASKGEIVKAVVTSPLGDPVEGIFGKLPDDTVVLEMASASGLPLVSPEKESLINVYSGDRRTYPSRLRLESQRDINWHWRKCH